METVPLDEESPREPSVYHKNNNDASSPCCGKPNHPRLWIAFTLVLVVVAIAVAVAVPLLLLQDDDDDDAQPSNAVNLSCDPNPCENNDVCTDLGEGAFDCTPAGPCTPDPCDAALGEQCLNLGGGQFDCLYTPTSSDFEGGTEGWTINGDAQGSLIDPTWVASGGNPGGHISATDDGQGVYWYFRAATKFHGNFAGAYDKALSFDLKQSGTNDQRDRRDVIIQGSSMLIWYDTSSNPGTSWTSYLVALNEAAGWQLDDNSAATEADIRSVLSDIVDLQIRGEYIYGPDSAQLDNVVLGKTLEVDPSPPPSDSTATDPCQCRATYVDPCQEACGAGNPIGVTMCEENCLYDPNFIQCQQNCSER